MSIRIKLIQKLLHFADLIFFYPKLERFYKSHINKQGINVIDVGANKGQSIDFFLRLYPKSIIYSFEPNVKLYKCLKEKYNKFNNVIIYQKGISNFCGQLDFNENVIDETSSFEQLNYNSKYLITKAKVLGVAKENIVIDTYSVDVIRLADFLINKEGFVFDVLKIDVEGHEYKVLQGLFNSGLKKQTLRFIQLESHNDDMYLDVNRHNEIEKLLKKNYFDKIAVIKNVFGDFVDIIYENKQYET